MSGIETTTTHYLHLGHDEWIDAKRVWVEMPSPEVDAAQDDWGWEFNNTLSLLRWLRA